MDFLIGVLSVLFTVTALLIILMVLFRPSEGGGLSGAFGGMGGDTAFGVKATQVIDKIIASVAIGFVLLAILIAWLTNSARSGSSDDDGGSPSSLVAPAEPGQTDGDDGTESPLPYSFRR